MNAVSTLKVEVGRLNFLSREQTTCRSVSSSLLKFSPQPSVICTKNLIFVNFTFQFPSSLVHTHTRDSVFPKNGSYRKDTGTPLKSRSANYRRVAIRTTSLRTQKAVNTFNHLNTFKMVADVSNLRRWGCHFYNSSLT